MHQNKHLPQGTMSMQSTKPMQSKSDDTHEETIPKQRNQMIQTTHTQIHTHITMRNVHSEKSSDIHTYKCIYKYVHKSQ